MSLSELHQAGGIPWMIPMDLVGLVNLGIVIYLIFMRATRDQTPEKPLEALRHLGGLTLAWGVFSTFVGLFQAFGALEAMKETLPFNIISGGLKVALITVLYGFIIYMLSLVAYLAFRLIRK